MEGLEYLSFFFRGGSLSGKDTRLAPANRDFDMSPAPLGTGTHGSNGFLNRLRLPTVPPIVSKHLRYAALKLGAQISLTSSSLLPAR